MSAPIYNFTAKTLNGQDKSLADYEGKVLLIVNTASECGLTPQFAGLEELNQQFKDQGLEILGFPCNQFGLQEPGEAHEIAAFCQRNYGVSFQMFDKIEVNGDGAHPLYKYLKATEPGLLGNEAIKWNFAKFLVDQDGQVVARISPNVEPKDLAEQIENLLGARV